LLDAKTHHNVVRLTDAGFCRLTFFKHDLQFKKMAQTFDVIEMYPCASGIKKDAALLYPLSLTVCLG